MEMNNNNNKKMDIDTDDENCSDTESDDDNYSDTESYNDNQQINNIDNDGVSDIEMEIKNYNNIELDNETKEIEADEYEIPKSTPTKNYYIKGVYLIILGKTGLPLVKAKFYPDEKQMFLEPIFTKLLLDKYYFAPTKYNNNPSELFPLLICADVPKSLKTVYMNVCEKYFAQDKFSIKSITIQKFEPQNYLIFHLILYRKHWEKTLFCRDVFHIIDKIKSKLKRQHQDYKYAFRDFTDIFRKLRLTEGILPNIKWKSKLFDKFLQSKNNFLEY